MKHVCVSLLALMVLMPVRTTGQEKKPETTTHVTLPGPSTPTVPADTMFALGQQSIQLQTISAKLDKMEPDVAQERRDVDRLLFVYNMFAYGLVLIISIVASYVLVRLIKKFWPEPQPPAPSIPPSAPST
jgi:hypothetical protein